MSELTEKIEVTIQAEQAEKSEKTEKPRTLNSVRRELQRLEKSKEDKKKKIKTLTEEIKAENAKIKELEAVYDELYHEDLQKQISNAWFKKGGLSGGQIEKILQLSKEIKDKIDILDVDTVVQAVNTAYEQKQNEQTSDAETERLAPVLTSVPDENKEQNPVDRISLKSSSEEIQSAINPSISIHTPEIRNRVTT